MTLEYLLGISAEEWDKLTDSQLEQWAQQFYHVTRPDPNKQKRVVEEKKQPSRVVTRTQRQDIQRILQMAEKLKMNLKH
jgi:transposase-like protein